MGERKETSRNAEKEINQRIQTEKKKEKTGNETEK